MNNPTARKNNREEEQSRSRIESTIPPPVSTRTDSPIQQGFAVQDKELPETSIGTFPGRERERVAAQKAEPNTHGKGPFYRQERGRPKGRGEVESQGAPPPHAPATSRGGEEPHDGLTLITHMPFKRPFTHMPCGLSTHLPCRQYVALYMHPCHTYVAAT